MAPLKPNYNQRPDGTRVLEEQTIHVILVDDHPIVRNGLIFSLSVFDDIQIVGEAANGQDAVQICRERSPDVVLMDMIMPGMDGVAATRMIRHYCPRTKVLILSSFPQAEYVRSALQAGAIGYLLKSMDLDDLAQAIRAARAGETIMAKEAIEALLHASAGLRANIEELTKRQREVLKLVVAGRSNQEIADELFVSPHTARFHVSEILSKLGAANRAEAAAIAVKERLVDQESRPYRHEVY